MNWNAVTIISVIMAIFFMIVNMKIAHGLAHMVNRKILLDETQSKPLPAP